MELTKFKDVALKYKTIFFDAYGVLKNYKGLIPGIEKTLGFLDKHGIDYYVVTNDASRSPEELANGYIKNGLDHIRKEKIISSGMIAHEYLQHKVKNGTVAYLGTYESAHYIETAGLKTISINDLNLEDNTDNINALVLLDDEGFDWNHDINKAINLIRKQNMPVIIANTDKVYPVAKHEVSVAVGGIANMIEEIVGKQFIRFGKPDAQMFNFAYQFISKNRDIQKDDILMVGDSLHTDIMGGNKFGLDTVLVLTGNTLPHQAEMFIRTTGIIPNYVCEDLSVD